MSRKPPPLTSFGPELLEVWRKAATTTVTIPCPDRGAATRLRYRLYSLRKALVAYGHELASTAQYATITISSSEPGKFILKVCPADQDLKAVLEEAGISVPDAPDIDLPEF